MAKLTKKIEQALDETRMLTLGAEVLLGLEYRSVFEDTFDRLPLSSQYLKVVTLGLMLTAISLLMWPVAYHRIVEQGENSENFQQFITCALEPALLPFAVAMGLDLYVVSRIVIGSHASIAAGAAAVLCALIFWYGVEYFQLQKCQHSKRNIRYDENSE